MGNIMRTGLCALLIGIPSPALNYSTLEQSIEAPKEIIIQQKPFIGPKGNYSLGRNPNDYGFYHIPQDIGAGFSYDDAYVSEMGLVRIGCAKGYGGLQELYDAYMGAYGVTFSRLVTKDFADGQAMRLVGRGEPKNLVIDNNPALQGGAEYWVYRDQNSLVQDAKEGKYTQDKYTVLTTLAQGKNGNAYMFTLFYLHDDKVKDAQADAFYNEVIRSFHALK